MFVSLLLLASQTLTAHPAVAAGQDPPVRVWFNSGGNYAAGDRAKVYAKSLQDGYLIVLRADGAGRVRVLYPLDPRDDQRVAGGKKQELKSRAGREAFVAGQAGEHGTVLAAVAPAPFRVDAFVRDGHWDLDALSSERLREDPEGGLIDLVGRMKTTDEVFNYAIATYAVSQQYARSLYPYAGLGWGYDPYWGYSRFGFGFHRRIIVIRQVPVRGH